MRFSRSSGILLHPTSFPGPDGIGDLGPEAYRWVNFLATSGCSLWQVLPLGPTGYGDSPYQCFSAFAGNPYLISPTILLDEGLLMPKSFTNRPAFDPKKIDYGKTIQWKIQLLDQAYQNFKSQKKTSLKAEFENFILTESFWLTDFTLFLAIKESQGGISWDNWPAQFRLRDTKTLAEFQDKNQDTIQKHAFRQFIFYKQWLALKNYANAKGISIIGDIPIFVAFDSADAWANPDLFFIDEKGKPTVVAGVPPDYFSPTGQLWGNPLYNWEVHKNKQYSWWIQRIKSTLKLVDIIRMDHFRGFAGYWEVPYGNPTAEIGKWTPGPGKHFFESLQQHFGDLPILAEDLGKITEDVIELRDTFHLPGMRILQFGFSSDPDDPFLPHNYIENCVAYTGTHDNDTVLGWYNSAPEGERDFCRRYFARSGNDISWDMIRAIWSSVAAIAITPLQDLLKLDSSGRMNFPGKPSGNWNWRYLSSDLTDDLNGRIQEINFLYSRSPQK